MEIKKVVELDTIEKATLNTAREVIADICEEFNNIDCCEECPLFTICDTLRDNSNIDFHGLFTKVVDILTEKR